MRSPGKLVQILSLLGNASNTSYKEDGTRVGLDPLSSILLTVY